MEAEFWFPASFNHRLSSLLITNNHRQLISCMQRPSRAESVGIVTPQNIHISEPLALSSRHTLKGYELVYETYGELNSAGTNAVLLCHALSGHHHAAGYYTDDPNEKPGWWEFCVGPGKPVDTNRFFVVVPNNIGGCHGSTGPNTINPATGKYWGADFPGLRFRDWVHSQRQLADALGIATWAAVVGGSLGGMQAMRWALEYPERLRHCVVLASAMSLTPQNIAFNELARRAISADPHYCEGRYLEAGKSPDKGLALARMIAHVTYVSQDDLEQRFGRDLKVGSFERGRDSELEFQVESYLNYKGDQFSEQFDANTYLLITRMLDVFDLAREYNNDAVAAFSHAECDFFVASFTTDWRFSSERSREIANALMAAKCNLSYIDVETDKGHDGFLLPIPRYINAFSAYMQRVAAEVA